MGTHGYLLTPHADWNVYLVRRGHLIHFLVSIFSTSALRLVTIFEPKVEVVAEFANHVHVSGSAARLAFLAFSLSLRMVRVVRKHKLLAVDEQIWLYTLMQAEGVVAEPKTLAPVRWTCSIQVLTTLCIRSFIVLSQISFQKSMHQLLITLLIIN